MSVIREESSTHDPGPFASKARPGKQVDASVGRCLDGGAARGLRVLPDFEPDEPGREDDSEGEQVTGGSRRILLPFLGALGLGLA